MIDKKRVVKSLIIISLIILIIFATIKIRKTLARYETNATGQGNVDVAFWIVDNSFESQRLLIDNIFPRSSSFDYTFTVANYKGSKSAETDLDYEIEIITTTNLPLSYTITKDGETCTKVENLFTDEDGTVYRKIKLETEANNLRMLQEDNKQHTFEIQVNFPKSYSANQEYADLIEDVKINLTAKQVID